MREVSFLSLLLLSVLIPSILQAEDEKLWPSSWFEAPKTAGERGIKEFMEPAELQKLVKAGMLPPVRGRLPHDPVVIDPYERVGEYCGSIRIFKSDRDKLSVPEGPLAIGPNISRILLNLAESYTLSKGGRRFKITLRKGLRWSDGHPFTADDFEFTFTHYFFNKELNSVPPDDLRSCSFRKVDNLTFYYEFKTPNPFFVNRFAHSGENYYLPSHFMKAFHSAFAGKEKVETMAKEAGLRNWMSLFNAAYWNALDDPAKIKPTMRSHVLVKKKATMLVYERNPYYFKVDPEGRQLPYIKTVYVKLEGNKEVIAAKTATGQVHFSAYSLKTADIPLFKMGEEDGLIKVYIWKRIVGSDAAIQPNLNHKDPVKRAVFNDLRFRKALSHAINRDEINAVLYFNRGVPRQTTVVPTSRFYEKEFATAHLKFDPGYSKNLLDEMGMQDIDGDGFREGPDGMPFNISMEWVDFEGAKALMIELLSEYWRQIGLNFQHRQIDRSLQEIRASAGLMDMTVWHADRSTDILFPPQPFWYVPMHIGWEECHWNEWARYYLTDGNLGERPEKEIRRLLEWWITMRTTADETRQINLGKKILRSNAENLWTIGTVGLTPMPVVIRPEMRNVPKMGYWGWDGRFSAPLHPETWFFDKKRKKK